jgi:hypothetical protein
MTRSSLVALAISAAAVVPASATVSLDRFLSGIDLACATKPDFETFWRSLNRKYNADGDAAASVVLPPTIANAMGTVSAVRKEDHVRVEVPLTGTYRNLKVKALNFAFGTGNGIFGYSVVFDEPADKVHKALDRAVVAGNKSLKQTAETAASTGIKADTSGVALYCSWSD